MASPEQIAANRINATRSTGPKSESGKARSRRNALKHGLTGEGVAVSDEDAAAIQERFESFEADLRPRGTVAQYLVRRVAMLSVRLERCVRNEAAAITRGMLQAVDVEEDQQAEEVERQVALLDEKPALAVRRLRRTPEGIARLIEEWEALRLDLGGRVLETWTDANRERAERLTGRTPRAIGGSRIAALSAAIGGDLRLLNPADWPGLQETDRRRAAIQELGRIIDAEIAGLKADHDALDHDAIEQIRATAPARAIFDTSKEAILARKYEAAAEREFYKAVKQAERSDEVAEAREAAEGPASPEPTADATPNEAEISRKSGSFFPRNAGSPGTPNSRPYEAQERPIGRPDRAEVAPNEPLGRG